MYGNYDGESWDDYLSDQMDDLLCDSDEENVNIIESDESEDISNATEFRRQERENYLKVDEQFKQFLSDFVSNQNEKDNQKRKLKESFFWFIMVCFSILIVSPIGVLGLIIWGKLSDVSAVGAIVSILIELVSAILVLPKIIAEYLFDKEEDKNMMDLIKNMQDYNEKKHDHIN